MAGISCFRNAVSVDEEYVSVIKVQFIVFICDVIQSSQNKAGSVIHNGKVLTLSGDYRMIVTGTGVLQNTAVKIKYSAENSNEHFRLVIVVELGVGFGQSFTWGGAG